MRKFYISIGVVGALLVSGCANTVALQQTVETSKIAANDAFVLGDVAQLALLSLNKTTLAKVKAFDAKAYTAMIAVRLVDDAVAPPSDALLAARARADDQHYAIQAL